MCAENYKILRSLNLSGTVTLAESAADGRKYVLKELTEESAPIYRRISELPAQENLMQVREIFRQSGRITAVCEYIEGQPLNELSENGKAFPVAGLCRIITQLCRAAEHLHRYGIIHRDITPKNIILDGNLHLTLIDYDISRQFIGNRERDTTLYGTEGFAPPEQYGFRETRSTADIYAIGMLLKLLLNACPDCPPAQEVILRKIAAKCTQFVPEKRYRSAGAVCRAVGRSRFAVPAGIAAASAAVLAGICAAVLLNARADEIPAESPQAAAEIQTEASSTVPDITVRNEMSSVVTEVPETSRTEQHGTVIATTASNVQTSADTETQATPAATSARTMPETTAIQTKKTEATSTAASITISKPAETTATTAETTAKEIPQELLPKTLHISDTDNPDKMTVTTSINERGYYEDYFEYVFYDDPAVHGEWKYCTALPVEMFNSAITSDFIRNFSFDGETLYSSLNIGDNGAASVILADGTEMPWNSYWTNGYLISELGDGTVAERLFEVTLDDEEFLFLALKTGDFYRENKVYCFAVFTRAE